MGLPGNDMTSQGRGRQRAPRRLRAALWGNSAGGLGCGLVNFHHHRSEQPAVTWMSIH